MRFSQFRDQWIYTELGEQIEKVVYAGLTVDISRVTKRHVRPNCIAVNPSFYNQNKTKTNAISAFELPSINLRYYCTALSYYDMLKNKKELVEAYDFIKEFLLNQKGCLITDHGPQWKRLVRELVEQDKNVYVTLPNGRLDVYRCSMSED